MKVPVAGVTNSDRTGDRSPREAVAPALPRLLTNEQPRGVIERARCYIAIQIRREEQMAIGREGSTDDVDGQ